MIAGQVDTNRKVRERPILFSAPMVRAILDGSKTQTRRPIKSPAKNMQRAGMQVLQHREPGDSWYGDRVWSMRNRMGVWGDYTHEKLLALCPFGAPGDRLWVREAFALIWPGEAEPENVRENAVEYRADGDESRFPGEWPPETRDDPDRPRWRPSIHMPRWASRITLEVTGVRVERAQDVSDDDILAEGVTREVVAEMLGCHPGSIPTLQDAWRLAWMHIYGAESWEANPWLWVIEFRRVEVNER